MSTNKNIKKEKNIYRENVSMTGGEYKKLLERFGKSLTDKFLDKLDNYKGARGKKYKSDYRAILSWVVDSVKPNQDVHYQTAN